MNGGRHGQKYMLLCSCRGREYRQGNPTSLPHICANIIAVHSSFYIIII